MCNGGRPSFGCMQIRVVDSQPRAPGWASGWASVNAFAPVQLRVGAHARAPIVCPLVGILPFASSGPRPWRELNPHACAGQFIRWAEPVVLEMLTGGWWWSYCTRPSGQPASGLPPLPDGCSRSVAFVRQLGLYGAIAVKTGHSEWRAETRPFLSFSYICPEPVLVK